MDIKQAIREADDLPLQPVVCNSWANNGWDGTVYVRTMTGLERDAFEHVVSKATKKNDNRGLKMRLVILTSCDNDGERLFKDDDAEWLEKKSAVEIDKIATAALQANGFSDKDVEELEGN